jgi:phenylacetate 2-hydroxylase
MRLLPKSNAEAVEFRERRDKYLTFLLNKLKKQIAEGTDKPCITGNILKDPEAKLNESKSSTESGELEAKSLKMKSNPSA